MSILLLSAAMDDGVWARGNPSAGASFSINATKCPNYSLAVTFLKSLPSNSVWCRIMAVGYPGILSSEVIRLLTLARSAARKGSAAAKSFCGFAFAAIAILIVTVGVLSTESRLPNIGQGTNSWHTCKTSRMTDNGVDELAPVRVNEAEVVNPVIPSDYEPHLRAVTSPLPELTGAPQAHGLRAPPLS